MKKQCDNCGESIELKDGEYSCITSTFEQHKDKDYIFYASSGYNTKEAADFITNVRLQGDFGVIIKNEDVNKLKEPLSFEQLLKLDKFLECI